MNPWISQDRRTNTVSARLSPLVLAGCVAIVGGVAAGGWWGRRAFWVVTVRGSSMMPTQRAGDRVLVRRTHRVRRGDVVVLSAPPQAERVRNAPSESNLSESGEWLMVKRVVAVAGDEIPPQVRHGSGLVGPGLVVVQGDSDRSYDSRHWGPVALDLVRGKVVRQLGSTRSR